MSKLGQQRALHLAIVAAALGLRLVALPDRPFHSDEAAHAILAWQGNLSYNPVFHGPVQLTLMMASYFILGPSDFAARLPAALAGTVIVALPYLLRRELGSIGALAAAGLLAISPSFLYYSRFAREDIFFSLVTLAIVVVSFAYLRSPRRWHPPVLCALAAVSLATKEATFLTGLIVLSFLAVALGIEAFWMRRWLPGQRPGTVTSALRAVGWRPWLVGLAAAAGIFIVLFSAFFSDFSGVQRALVDSWAYWISRQDVNLGAQPPYYYLLLLLAYELPIVLLGAVGVAVALHTRSVPLMFLLWMFALSLLVYSWAAERMPWLVLHPLLPLILLAGLGFQFIWDRRGELRGAFAVSAAAVGAAALMVIANRAVYLQGSDPSELLAYVPTSPRVIEVRDRVLALNAQARASGARALSVEYDTSEGASNAWMWYLRDLEPRGVNAADPGYRPAADVLLISEPTGTRQRIQPTGYSSERFPMFTWWVPGWSPEQPRSCTADTCVRLVPNYGSSIDAWFRWLVLREPWSPEGSSDQWLFVREGLVQP